MHTLSLQELRTGLLAKEFSAFELCEYFLDRIEQHQALNCFISLDKEFILECAKSIDIHQGKLAGIPMGVKDLFCTSRMNTTCGSRMLSHYRSPFSATLINNLQKQGALSLGKTNMDEFAMGSSNENSYFGSVKNPWNTSKVPGGSSGGSAAAVAAGLVPFALGSDTGGSIRQPAAFCGISGIKPTYGLVSRYGMVAYASSLDQAGPMAKSAEDLALVLESMAGFDPKDSTSADTTIPQYSQAIHKPLDKFKIGLPKCFNNDAIEPGIRQAIQDALQVLQKMGGEIVELEFNYDKLWIPCYYVIACAEASSNLARYDGIRFGHRSDNAKTLREMLVHSRSEGFGMEVKRRILTGTHVLSSGYYDAYYLQALKIRRLIQNELNESLKTVDLIVGPTTPTTAFALGEKLNDPIQNYLADIFTVAVNLAGLPALSIPAGFSNQLPVGMQLIGKAFDESKLLQTAHHFQLQTEWHKAEPKIGDTL